MPACPLPAAWSLQVWEADSGEGFTNIEPQDADINDVCVWPGSGLIMVGCDTGEHRQCKRQRGGSRLGLQAAAVSGMPACQYPSSLQHNVRTKIRVLPALFLPPPRAARMRAYFVPALGPAP